MIFQDFTLAGGRIYSRRQQNTKTLAPQALAVCRQMLSALRGETQVPQPVEDLPPFTVSLGPPDWLRSQLGQQVEAAGRFFCCALPGLPPFQINVVLPQAKIHPGGVSETEERAVGTLLGLSLGGSMPPGYDVEARVREITQARPVLATTLMPMLGEDMLGAMETIQIAADFSTCFAAVLLEE